MAGLSGNFEKRPGFDGEGKSQYSLFRDFWVAAIEPIEGEFHFECLDEMFDNAYKRGDNVVLAALSGARPAWLSQKYPEVLRTNEYGLKLNHGDRRNHCFSSAVYLEKTAKTNNMLAKRYVNHPELLIWHISNEYGGCHCELCQENFRCCLKNKYGSLEKLNHEWWAPFWSHTITDWSQI